MSFGTIIKNSSGNTVIDSEYPSLEFLPTTTIQTATMIQHPFSWWYFDILGLASNEEVFIDISDYTTNAHITMWRRGGRVTIWSPIQITPLRYIKYVTGSPTITGSNPFGFAVKNANDDFTFTSTSKLISVKDTLPVYTQVGSYSTLVETGPYSIPSTANFFSFQGSFPVPVYAGPGNQFWITTGILRDTSTSFKIKSAVIGYNDINFTTSPLYYRPLLRGFIAGIQ